MYPAEKTIFFAEEPERHAGNPENFSAISASRRRCFYHNIRDADVGFRIFL